jgi:hypothetical protein
MTPPHSTQRTFPALCSSSETQSEITRLCAQAKDGLIERVCGTCFGTLRFMAHILGRTKLLQRICAIVIILHPQCKTENMGTWAVRLLILSVATN